MKLSAQKNTAEGHKKLRRPVFRDSSIEHRVSASSGERYSCYACLYTAAISCTWRAQPLSYSVCVYPIYTRASHVFLLLLLLFNGRGKAIDLWRRCKGVNIPRLNLFSLFAHNNLFFCFFIILTTRFGITNIRHNRDMLNARCYLALWCIFGGQNSWIFFFFFLKETGTRIHLLGIKIISSSSSVFKFLPKLQTPK